MAGRKVLIVDTSILCAMLGVPGKAECGPEHDRWTQDRTKQKVEDEIKQGTTLVLPLATIIETGNHIAQTKHGNRLAIAQQLANIIRQAANGDVPWAAVAEQQNLWNADGLTQIAQNWPVQAVQGISMGDFTIASVANRYHQVGFWVEILTGDQGLKAMEPSQPLAKQSTRRRRSRRHDS